MATALKFLFVTYVCFFWLSSSAQQSTNYLPFDGLNRSYKQYIPQLYDSTESTPVVFWFHPLNSNGNNFLTIDLDLVADTANFIIISPNALTDPLINTTAWNAGMESGGWSPNADVDDVGFTMAILDTLSSRINIDPSKVYAAGSGTGGFFVNRLACEHPEVFEAIASVRGTIGIGINCEPSSAIRIAEFHGTEDDYHDYYEGGFGNSTPEWIAFWQSANGCDDTLINGPLPDTQDDGLTIDYFRYANCSENSEVVHYRINEDGGYWLTADNDLNYTTEIWLFFLGVQPQLVSGVADSKWRNLHVYPNPATTTLTIELPANTATISNVELIDLTGRVSKLKASVLNGLAVLDFNGLSNGTYMVRVVAEDDIYVSRVVIQ